MLIGQDEERMNGSLGSMSKKCLLGIVDKALLRSGSAATGSSNSPVKCLLYIYIVTLVIRHVDLYHMLGHVDSGDIGHEY